MRRSLAPIVPHVSMQLARFDATVQNDCAIWCLATFLSRSYERVVAAAAKVDADAGLDGLYFEQMIQVARGFGVTLREVPAVNLDEATGILGVTFKGYAHAHVVILKQGQVINMRGIGLSIWDVDAFLASKRATVDGLLALVE